MAKRQAISVVSRWHPKFPSRRYASRLGLILVLVAGSAPILAVPAGAADQVSCGAIIKSNTTLQKDLVNCPNNGLVVDGDNVTLDLNGHSIDGDGAATADCPAAQACDVGVTVLPRHKGVKVVGGSLRRFTLGVLVEPGSVGDTLRHLALSNLAGVGIFVVTTEHSFIEQNEITGPGVTGIIVSESQHMSIARNVVTGTTGYAVVLNHLEASRIEHNRLQGDKHGFNLGESSTGNAVRHNSVIDTGGGIEVVSGSTWNRVEHNQFIRVSDGLLVTGTDNMISGNRVTAGLPDGGGFGIILDGAVRTTVDHNRFLTAGPGPAVFLTQLEEPRAPQDNVIMRNRVTSRAADGIRVDAGATGTLLIRNRAVGSGDDGIDVQAPGTTVTGNVANGNRDLGIVAVPGVVDGGHNHAVHNGNPAQCVNVDCR